MTRIEQTIKTIRDVLLYILCTIAGVVAVGAAAMYFSGRSKKESGE